MYNNPLIYNDLTGEWFGIDDLIAGVIGGIVNLTVNAIQGNLKGNFWEVIGKGAAAFGSGFAAGTLSLYGPGGWAAGGAIIGGTNAWLSGGDVWQGVGTGVVSGLIGGQFGKWSGQLGGVVINGLKTSSPLIQSLVGGIIGGGLGGSATNFTLALVTGASFDEALDAGWRGFKNGAVIGGLAGVASGYVHSQKNGIDFLNGKQLAAKASANILKPLGRGSTGRTVANNLTEQLAMKEIMNNPSAGQIIKKSLSDPRWQGWTKMSNKTAHGVEIHFNALWENGVIKSIDDFKFISP